MHMQIEFTNHCNLRCIECPHRFLRREFEHMKPRVFETILQDYIVPLAPNTIICHKDGEPLLHPSLMHNISRIDHKVLTKFDIYTNGLLLKPDFVQQLNDLRSKVWVLVSFHFFDEHGKFVDQYNEKEATIIECIQNAGSNVEFIFASHVTDYANEEILEGWKKAWEDRHLLRLSAVHVNKAINPWLGLIHQDNCIEFHDCPYTDGEHMFFGVTGNVLACCMDLEEEIIFGNVLEDDINVIMKKRDAFYKELQNNQYERHVCKRCLGGRKLL